MIKIKHFVLIRKKLGCYDRDPTIIQWLEDEVWT